MPIVDQDDKFFLTDTGGKVAKSGLSPEKRSEYESMLGSKLVSQPNFILEPAAAPMNQSIQPPQSTDPFEMPSASYISSADQLGLGQPQQLASTGQVMDLSPVNQQPAIAIPETDPSIIEGYNKGIALQEIGVKEQANAIEKRNIEANRESERLQRLLDQDNYKIMQIGEKRAEALRGAQADIDNTIKDYETAKVDPDRFFGNDNGRRLLAGIAIAFGGIGQAMTGSGSNAALDIINKAIDRDIDSQKSNRDALAQKIGMQRQAAQDLRMRFQDDQEAALAQRVVTIDMAQRKIEEIGNRYNTDEARAKASMLTGQLQISKAEAMNKLNQKRENDAINALESMNKRLEKSTSLEDKYRKERESSPEYQRTALRQDAVNTMEAATTDSTGAGDIAFIFAYMKSLDPGSTVREGEFATAENSGGIPDRVRNLYNKAMNGDKLNPEQREDFLAKAKGILQASQKELEKKDAGLRNIVQSRSLDPEMVFINRSPQSLTQQSLNSLTSLSVEGEEPKRANSTARVMPGR